MEYNTRPTGGEQGWFLSKATAFPVQPDYFSPVTLNVPVLKQWDDFVTVFSNHVETSTVAVGVQGRAIIPASLGLRSPHTGSNNDIGEDAYC